MIRSSYTYTLGHDHLTIIDLNREGFKSVTNDMEMVLRDIHVVENRDLSGLKIIYNDSDGHWDGVNCKNLGTFESPKYQISFYPLKSEL